jgi:hydroxyethylthiazole kinase-like uncharacterized protein yjeF
VSLIQRDPESNKGDHGTLAILGGSAGMVGAAVLSARCALWSGTGRVVIARLSLADGFVLDAVQPEVMVIDVNARASRPITTRLIGPGLGTSDEAAQILQGLMSCNLPVVLDADALNLMAQDPALQRQCARRSAPTVITPHPGEAGRLLNSSAQHIQTNRAAGAARLSQQLNAITVLKGHRTLIASADGEQLHENMTGNAALACGGTGDVLAGLIGALIAQGCSPMQAALTGCRLHGEAAERLSERLGGMIGVTAGELIPEIRLLLNQAPPLARPILDS